MKLLKKTHKALNNAFNEIVENTPNVKEKEYKTIKEVIKQQKALKSPNKTNKNHNENKNENKNEKIIEPLQIAMKHKVSEGGWIYI